MESWPRPFYVWLCLLLPSLYLEAATGPKQKKKPALLHHRVLQPRVSSPVADKARSNVTPPVCSAFSFGIHPERFQTGSSVSRHSIESVCLYSPRRRVRCGLSKAKARRPCCARAVDSRWSHRWSRPEGSKSPEPSGTEHRRGREKEEGPGGGELNQGRVWGSPLGARAQKHNGGGFTGNSGPGTPPPTPLYPQAPGPALGRCAAPTRPQPGAAAPAAPTTARQPGFPGASAAAPGRAAPFRRRSGEEPEPRPFWVPPPPRLQPSPQPPAPTPEPPPPAPLPSVLDPPWASGNAQEEIHLARRASTGNQLRGRVGSLLGG